MFGACLKSKYKFEMSVNFFDFWISKNLGLDPDSMTLDSKHCHWPGNFPSKPNKYNKRQCRQRFKLAGRSRIKNFILSRRKGVCFYQCCGSESGSESTGAICFWAFGSGSISQRYGSGSKSGSGSIPFLTKVLRGLK
jgi:hypothetical protein